MFRRNRNGNCPSQQSPYLSSTYLLQILIYKESIAHFRFCFSCGKFDFNVMLIKTSSNVFGKVCRVNRHRSILILKTNIEKIIVYEKLMEWYINDLYESNILNECLKLINQYHLIDCVKEKRFSHNEWSAHDILR
jgi:hypothetical protein